MAPKSFRHILFANKTRSEFYGKGCDKQQTFKALAFPKFTFILYTMCVQYLLWAFRYSMALRRKCRTSTWCRGPGLIRPISGHRIWKNEWIKRMIKDTVKQSQDALKPTCIGSHDRARHPPDSSCTRMSNTGHVLRTLPRKQRMSWQTKTHTNR